MFTGALRPCSLKFCSRPAGGNGPRQEGNHQDGLARICGVRRAQRHLFACWARRLFFSHAFIVVRQTGSNRVKPLGRALQPATRAATNLFWMRRRPNLQLLAATCSKSPQIQFSLCFLVFTLAFSLQPLALVLQPVAPICTICSSCSSCSYLQQLQQIAATCSKVPGAPFHPSRPAQRIRVKLRFES